MSRYQWPPDSPVREPLYSALLGLSTLLLWLALHWLSHGPLVGLLHGLF